MSQFNKKHFKIFVVQELYFKYKRVMKDEATISSYIINIKNFIYLKGI